MAQLVASVSSVVLGGVVMVVGSNLARGKIFTASICSVDSYLSLSLFLYIYNIYSTVYIYIKCGNNMGSNLARGQTINIYIYNHL